MRSQLVIIHKSRQAAGDQPLPIRGTNWLLWETCMRRLAFAPAPEEVSLEADQDYHFYQGSEAYKFLTEIVCGLHSPIKGETEVHGQYREFLEKVNTTHPLYKVLQKVHLDARKIRSTCLQGLGSQSYGSFARKKARSANEIHVVGAGHLTREILPWILKLSKPIYIYVRNVNQYLEFAEQHKNIQLLPLESLSIAKQGALLVSAPVAAENFKKNVELEQFQCILDFRAESKVDPLLSLGSASQYLTLNDIFNEIESVKQKVDLEVGRARQMIETLCQ